MTAIIERMIENASERGVLTEVIQAALEVAQQNPDYDIEQICITAQLEWDIY